MQFIMKIYKKLGAPKIIALLCLVSGALFYLRDDIYATGIVHKLLVSCSEKLSAHEPTENSTPRYAALAEPLKKPLQDIDNVHDIDMSDGLAELILKHAPILYLNSAERYLPISAEEYFLGFECAPMKKGKNKIYEPLFDNSPLADFEPLYDLRQKEGIGTTDKQYSKNIHMHIGECVKFGSDPAAHWHATKRHNGQPVLCTPAYVMTFEQHGNLYIQYMFLYGFNGPYQMALPGKKIYLNPHEGDLEHFTIELDRETKKIRRYFYAAHEINEGVKMYPHQVSQERDSNGGVHPIVYIARGSHAAYSKEGVYVRVFGLADDHTKEGIRWEPNLIRVYQNNDERFDSKTMGWLYFPGKYGKRGVPPAYAQEWFANIDGDIIDPRIFRVRFCEHGKWLHRRKEAVANAAELLVIALRKIAGKTVQGVKNCLVYAKNNMHGHKNLELSISQFSEHSQVN